MLTSSGSISPIKVSTPHPSTATCGTSPNRMTPKCDSSNFSNHAGNTDSFFMNLVSRMAQDVRTATTTADIRQLHTSVQSGEYVPNPDTIAYRMLFFTEE